MPDSRRVAQCRQVLQTIRDSQLQVQAALRCIVLERLGAVADQFGEVERDVLQFQGGTFNAREVEDIVDHLEQVLGGLRRKRGIFGLLFGHPGGFQQLQHA